MIEKHARKEAEQDRKPQLIDRTDPNQEFPEQPKTNDKQDAQLQERDGAVISQAQAVEPVLQTQHVVVVRPGEGVVVDFSDLTRLPDVLELPGHQTGKPAGRIETEAKQVSTAAKAIHAFQCLRPSKSRRKGNDVVILSEAAANAIPAVTSRFLARASIAA